MVDVPPVLQLTRTAIPDAVASASGDMPSKTPHPKRGRRNAPSAVASAAVRVYTEGRKNFGWRVISTRSTKGRATASTVRENCQASGRVLSAGFDVVVFPTVILAVLGGAIAVESTDAAAALASKSYAGGGTRTSEGGAVGGEAGVGGGADMAERVVRLWGVGGGLRGDW